MDTDGLLTEENDGDASTLGIDAIHRPIATPLRRYQAYCANGDVLQVSSNRMMATSEPRPNHGADQTHASSRLDPFTQIAREMRPSSLSHSHPHHHSSNPQTLGYNGIAQFDPAYQYKFSTAASTNPISQPDSRQGSVSIPMSPTDLEYPSLDNTRSNTLTRFRQDPTAWSQSRPSSQLESSTRSLVAPAFAAVNATVTSGYPYGTLIQSLRIRDHQRDHQRDMVASRPAPYPNPNAPASGMLQSRSSDRMSRTILQLDPSLQRHIQRHRQYGNRKFTLKSGDPHDELLYTPPTSTHATGDRVSQSFLPAYADGQNPDSSRRHVTLGSNGRHYGGPISIPYLEGASGQLQGPTLPPGAPHGHPGWEIDIPSSNCRGSATTTNTMRRTQPNSSPHIHRQYQYGNLESTLDSSSGSGQHLYSPRLLYARGYGAPSPVDAHVDGHDSPHHATLESSHPPEALSFPSPVNTRSTSGRDHGSMLQSFENLGDEGDVMARPSLPYLGRDMLVGNISRPQFNRQGHVPAYIGRGQAPLATTHTEDSGNNPAPYFASSNGQQNLSLRNPGPWGSSSAGPSTSKIPTRNHTNPLYGQFNTRELLPFTSPVEQSDLTISASPIRFFPDSMFNDIWSPQFNPHGQPSGNPPPSYTSSFRRGNPHQSTSIFTPSYPDLGKVFPGHGFTMDQDRSALSSLAIADEGQNNSAVTSATYHPTILNAQERLKRALKPSSPLKNKALIKLLLLIFDSSFFRMQEMEPTIDSDDGQALLGQIQQIADCPAEASHVSNDSIFTLFVAKGKFRCLICGKFKQSMVRAIGCVRSHLDHRPFHCCGDQGCDTCPKDGIVKKFYTASLLHEHCNRQERDTKCTSCGMILRGNMKRHWEAKHPDTPFPYDDYPNYQKE